MRAIKIVLVEDCPIDRAILTKSFQETNWLELVNSFMTGADFLTYYNDNDIDFELAIIDYRMPVLNGMDAFRSMNAKNQKIKLLLVSHGFYSQVIKELMSLGTQNYCRKTSETILHIIPLIMAGTPIWSTGDVNSADWETTSIQDSLKQKDESAWVYQISPLEKKIVCLLAKGHNSENIAIKLGYETSSIEKYRGIILKNLHLHNAQQLVAYALSNGVISSSHLFCNETEESLEMPDNLAKENTKRKKSPKVKKKKK
ncbi:MAG: response regulator [bacterium]|nr:response regulator [bacterium]